MVLRNRLVALLIRIVIFALYCLALGPYIASFDSGWVAICTMGVEMGILGAIVVGFEIVFNLIDLRHGVFGVAAGPYMPLALPIYAFCFLTGMTYFAVLLPTGAAPNGTFALILHATLLIGPLVDWIALDEKGTVPYFCGISCQLYPILFHVFGWFRTIIWPDTPIYNGNLYALPFLDYLQPNIVWFSIAFFATSVFTVYLFIFLNNVFTGKYRRVRLGED